MNDSIIFKNHVGQKITNDANYLGFINSILQINSSEYDDIYYFKNVSVAGTMLFVKGNNYLYVTLGSGRPIIGTERGTMY